jgi:hypothetical protein
MEEIAMRNMSGVTLCATAIFAAAILGPATADSKNNGKDQPELTDMLVYFALDATRVGVIHPDGTGES